MEKHLEILKLNIINLLTLIINNATYCSAIY